MIVPMTIDEILNNIYPLPDSSKTQLIQHIHEVALPKGSIIMKADKVEKKIYFIKTGIVRAYASTADQDITFWFGKEGETVVSMKSYVAQQKGYESIELLEDSALFELKTDDLYQLFENDIHIANWGRKFAEKELLILEERFISRQFQTATHRYQQLLRDNPYLLQRVSLGHIASFLGITQVSLSRIRAEIK